MRRYRAAPYYFGLWAIIAGLWLFLMVFWAIVMELGLASAAVSGVAGAALFATGMAAVRRSRTSEEVPETAAEAIDEAKAREAEAAGRERAKGPQPPKVGAEP